MKTILSIILGGISGFLLYMLASMVFLEGKPVLSCSVLAARANGCKVDTLEGLQEEAEEFGSFIAGQGAEQCGFCNPGMIMNAIALFRENPDPSEEEIKEYLCERYSKWFCIVVILLFSCLI